MTHQTLLDIVIVDDESLARDRLKRLVEQLGYEVAGEAANGEQALSLIHDQDPAIVLLDIEMPGQTGLQVADAISLLEHPPAVIFTTAYDQYALDAFSAFAAGYLLKPVNREELGQAITKALTLTKAQLTSLPDTTLNNASDKTALEPLPKHITVHSHRGVDLLVVDTIRYFMADSKYVTAVGTQGETLIDGTLKEYETKFSQYFARIHRNAIVAIDCIEGLQRTPEGGYTVRLRDIESQPIISRRYVSKIKALLDQR